jgi:hypothetical protein
MPGGRVLVRRPRSTCRTAVRRALSVVVAVLQLGLLLATGADSWRGRDASAHVERSGTRLHHAHDEATCVACTAQSLHAQAAPRTMPWPDAVAPHIAAAELASTPPRSQDHPSNGSRAPPLVS